MPRNRTTRSWAGALALALGALTLATGCGGDSSAAGSGGKTVLRYTWWGNPDRAERTDKAVKLFEKKHPGVRVQTSFAGFDSYKQKLATQAVGGDAPDVMQLDYRQIDQYARGGVLLDLDKRRQQLDTSDMDKELLRTGRVDDTLYAIPQGRGAMTLVYDARLWRKAGIKAPRPGWSWSEWADAVRTVAKRTGKAGATDPGQSEDAFEVWLRGRGKALYTKDGAPGFTAGDLATYWTFTDRLRRAGAVSTAEQTTQLDGTVENTPLGRGTAASDINWDAPASGYEPMLGDDVRLAPMPAGEDGTPGQYFKPSMFVGAAADTAHPDEAAELIDFLVNDPETAKILGANRGLPVNDTLRAELEPKLTGFDRTIADYQDSIKHAVSAPPQAPPAGDISLQTTFQRDYDQVSYAHLSPREAAEDYLTELKAELR